MLSVKGYFENGHIKIDQDIVTNSDREIPVIVTFLEDVEKCERESAPTSVSNKSDISQEKKYHFSDLAGKLGWDGDAVEEQRRIRDEW